MIGPIVGIDLGTTRSLVSVLEPGGPRLIPVEGDSPFLPSVVSLDEAGRLLTGRAALSRSSSHPESTALAFKRDMGRTVEWTLGPERLTPVALSAAILKRLKAAAEADLGHPVTEAVITVPAWFSDVQRRATRDAGALAGLQVERLVNEPTAAALAYGLHRRDTAERRILVVDLGGGTFDVTALTLEQGIFEVRATAGDSRLGGVDFDAALLDRVAPRLLSEFGRDPRQRPQARARLLHACERARVALTEAPEAAVQVRALSLGGASKDVSLPLTRAACEAAFEPLLTRLEEPLREAMQAAEFAPGALDDVLLVGGASRMPSVVRRVARVVGQLPARTLPPDEAVALGAAVQGALKARSAEVADLVVTDVAPFTLGISTVVDLGQHRVDGVFVPIIDRGTTIPASRVERFATASADQHEICIEIYQGEHSLCRDNQHLGTCRLTELPPRPAGEVAIDVRFTCDLNGLIEVEIVAEPEAEGPQVGRLIIEPGGGRLSGSALAEMQARLDALKAPSAELTPALTLLARGEARYLELTGAERAALGEALAAVRAAIRGVERGEPSAASMLERAGQALEEALSDKQ